MVYDRRVKSDVFRWTVPIPEDPEVLEEYLRLGWIRVRSRVDGDYLRWSFAKGTPRHPGDGSPEPAKPRGGRLH